MARADRQGGRRRAEGDRPSEGGTGQAADGARHLKKATAYFARASRRDPPRSRAIARSGRVPRKAECARSAPAAIAKSARGRGEERAPRSPAAGSAPWPFRFTSRRFSKAVFNATKGAYGWPRTWRELSARGI